MTKKQSELIKEYCLFIMKSSLLATGSVDRSHEIIYSELINATKVDLLKKVNRYILSKNTFKDV
jgi:hypothetical protein